jgi:hypothetical protein
MNIVSYLIGTNSDNVHRAMVLYYRCLHTRSSLLICGRVSGFMTEIPSDQHITYQLQYRKCGKASCSTCRNGQGHGPYWYAYWREGSRLRSGYVGKVHPHLQNQSTPPPGTLNSSLPESGQPGSTHTEQQETASTFLEEFVAAPVLQH